MRVERDVVHLTGYRGSLQHHHQLVDDVDYLRPLHELQTAVLLYQPRELLRVRVLLKRGNKVGLLCVHRLDDVVNVLLVLLERSVDAGQVTKRVLLRLNT